MIVSRNRMKRLALILVFAMVCSLLPTKAEEAKNAKPKLNKSSIHFDRPETSQYVKVIGVRKSTIKSIKAKSDATDIVKVEKVSTGLFLLSSTGDGFTTVHFFVKLKKRIKGKKSFHLMLNVNVDQGGPDSGSETTPAPGETPTSDPSAGTTPTPTAKASSQPSTNGLVSVPKTELNVGESMKITVSESMGKPQFLISDKTNGMDTGAIVINSETNTITAKKPGTATVMVLDQWGKNRVDTPEITVVDNTNPYVTVNIKSRSKPDNSGRIKPDKTKSAKLESGMLKDSVRICGTCSYEMLKKHLRLEVKDVTPEAYKKMFHAIGMNSDTLKVSMGNENLPLLTKKYIYANTSDPDSSMKEMTPVSGVDAMIEASTGVRDIKLTIYWDNEVKDVYYKALIPTSGIGDNSWDDKLYDDILRKVEEKLWSPGMTNLEKLGKLQKYINSTTYYPGYAGADSKTNPTCSDEWKVEGMAMQFDFFSTSTLEEISVWFGGVCDCTIVNTFAYIGNKHLGIPIIGNAIRTGEGLFVGVGEQSTAPYNPGHYTLWYQDPDGKRYGIDAQGMQTAYSDHNIEERIIKL